MDSTDEAVQWQRWTVRNGRMVAVAVEVVVVRGEVVVAAVESQ